MRNYIVILMMSVVSISGCATVLSGVDQEIVVNTTPPGAECDVFRDGTRIASVPSTPGTVEVDKTKHDLKILCRKNGYLETEAVLPSGAESSVFANILFGGTGLVLWGLDSITGADNSYPSSHAITLASPVTAKNTRRGRT